MSGDQLYLDAVARRVRDATELLEQEAHALRRDTAVRGRDTLAAQAIDAAAVMLRDDALALVAEVRRLREALDGRGVVLRDAYNDATRTRDAMARRAYTAEAEVRRLRAKVQRVEALAGEIERGEWGDHWRDINVHGAIRSRLATRDDV